LKEKEMKKMIILFVVCVLVLSGCASSPEGESYMSPTKTANDGRALTGGQPQFVKTAANSARKSDTLVGVGMARIGAAGLSQAKTIAEARARASISRQLNSVVREIGQSNTASSEVNSKDAVDYQETVLRTLSESKLKCASVIE
jgi:uncharacterized protein YceK